MGIVKIRYARDAFRDLKQIDKKTARRVVLKVKENSELKDPLLRAKALKGVLLGYHRYRVGDYRVIFKMSKTGGLEILKILRIKHRKEVYKL